ncbi:hypothetical protein CPB83DRAFT_882672 [Crepidotus variabilis]|uniref:3'-5' exonuclease n=1 Tax=Crepidotus variabilis TaxID=179855 RepID=A0A9P6EIL9_9AGAR|nr:hypothetical protein CPB83DRAFT_882672 [Crepidotus variabilis]
MLPVINVVSTVNSGSLTSTSNTNTCAVPPFQILDCTLAADVTLSTLLQEVLVPEQPVRKRGRPPKPKPVVPKRPRGRPPKKPVLLPDGENYPGIAKRRPGRPAKVAYTGVKMIQLDGPIIIPGSTGKPDQSRPGTCGVVAPLFRATSKLAHTAVLKTPLAISATKQPSAEPLEPAADLESTTAGPNPTEIDDDRGDGFGGGIGEEDESDDDDNDNIERDSNDNDDEDNNNTRKKQKKVPKGKRRPLPYWLRVRFEEFVLECNGRRNTQGLPPLYANKTFWSTTPSPFFSLNDDTSPQSLFHPQFFLWDPQAIVKQIPCPTCHCILIRHAHISRPRRIVTVNSTFWMIGYRYHCTNCRHPKTGKHSVTWQSWDHRILAVLPSHLASEFPAQLSHRSGISKTLFHWMRACFQNGMGAKQFADSLRVQHLQRYDELHAQYLNYLSSRLGVDTWRGRKYKSFLAFENLTDEGYHGYVPGSQWLRDMYDNFIEDHRQDFNQHMGMLSAEICAIDHSHKVTKHVAKVNGERIFNGLLTVTNEIGEIRSCNLVATKSHSQFELALVRLRESLDLYGLSPPKLFFTDNMADKAFLESSFPSLRQDIIPVEKYNDLEPFVLPSEIQILVRNETSSINAALSTIVDRIPVDEDDPELVIGYDSEWNVIISDDRTFERGEIAVVQIAFEKRVYLLQISEMVALRRLPEKLVMLLCNPRVRKVGRMVSSDLRQLQEAVRSSTPFIGALDLAGYAKERHVISNARSCSLADLCAMVLGKRMNKNVSERTSAAWENVTLTDKQKVYAACDAYVPLLIYNKLSHLSVPKRLPSTLAALIPVLVYATDNTTIIATGHISNHFQALTFDDIRITRTHTLVTVTSVQVPATLLTSHRKRPLLSFGEAPFEAVCLLSHLRTYDPSSFKMPLRSTDSTSGVTSLTMLKPVAVDALADDSDGAYLDSGDGAGSLLRELDMEDEIDAAELTRESVAKEKDGESEAIGRQILSAMPQPETWDRILHSRVLKDIFHVFNMLRLSSTHGLRKEFGRVMRDTLFIPNKEDRLRISAWGATLNPPKTFGQLVATRPAWVWRHCRRTVPPPNILFRLIQEFFDEWGPLKDATTKAPLFNQSHWKVAKQILELIRQGFISDPPDIPLYTLIGVDNAAGNLPIYRCSRGTNFTEGGVHTHLRSRLPTSGASVRHVNASLCDFVLQHNLRVGTFNRTGQAYRGHYSIWLISSIQEHLVHLSDVLIQPQHIKGWVNGNLYLPTSEQLGILPVPDDVRTMSGMAEYDHDPLRATKTRHQYLARMQGTHKAILPIHTPAEHDLFRSLMESNPAFNSESAGPIWKLAVKAWNQIADKQDGIFYKLVEQLKVYYTQWQTSLNVRQSLSLSSNVRKKSIKAARNPSRMDQAPQLSTRPLTLHSITHGYDIGSLLTPPTPMRGGQTETTRASEANPPSSSKIPPASTLLLPPPLSPPPVFGPPNIPAMIAVQRVIGGIQKAKPSEKKKKPRVCRRCGDPECSGRRAVKYCSNPCQDCARHDCLGRNPHRPSRKCDDAWK